MVGETLLLLSDALGHKSVVSSLLGVLLGNELLLQAPSVTLTLKTLRRDETLNPRGLRVRLGTLLLRLNLTANDVLTHIVFLGEVEELANVVSTLRTKTLGHSTLGVRQARNILLALLNNNAVQSLNVRANNAAAN